MFAGVVELYLDKTIKWKSKSMGATHQEGGGGANASVHHTLSETLMYHIAGNLCWCGFSHQLEIPLPMFASAKERLLIHLSMLHQRT